MEFAANNIIPTNFNNSDSVTSISIFYKVAFIISSLLLHPACVIIMLVIGYERICYGSLISIYNF